MGIGKRVQDAREMLEPSRSVFCDQYGLSYTTVRQWEKKDEAHPALGRLCEILFDNGIICDESWLLTGEGVKPYRVKESLWGAHLQRLQAKDIESRLIKKRLKLIGDDIVVHIKHLFKNYPHEHLIIGRIRDNDMAPFYQKGDFVAGLKEQQTIPSHDGQVGLLEIEPTRFIVRQLRFNKGELEINTTREQGYQPIPFKTPFYPLVWFHRDEPHSK